MAERPSLSYARVLGGVGCCQGKRERARYFNAIVKKVCGVSCFVYLINSALLPLMSYCGTKACVLRCVTGLLLVVLGSWYCIRG